jgi:collagen triple helix repeat protein
VASNKTAVRAAKSSPKTVDDELPAPSAIPSGLLGALGDVGAGGAAAPAARPAARVASTAAIAAVAKAVRGMPTALVGAVRRACCTCLEASSLGAETAAGRSTLDLDRTLSFAGDRVAAEDAGTEAAFEGVAATTAEEGALELGAESCVGCAMLGAALVTVETTGSAGVVGAAGTEGAVGAVGTVGAAGAVGTAGAVGAAGALGAAGVAGAAGAAGATGVAGAAGAVGAAGAAGKAGAAFVVGTGGAETGAAAGVGNEGGPAAVATPVCAQTASAAPSATLAFLTAANAIVSRLIAGRPARLRNSGFPKRSLFASFYCAQTPRLETRAREGRCGSGVG